jgi:hypothetical protein
MEMFHLFSPSQFMPHGHCYYWEPYLLWSHALSDGIIALAYCAIPLTLFYIYLKRKQDFQYLWMAVLFAVFILGCGVTHVFDVITIWNPLYYADSVVRIITAAASVARPGTGAHHSPTAANPLGKPVASGAGCPGGASSGALPKGSALTGAQ